jgi:hypothetical protein
MYSNKLLSNITSPVWLPNADKRAIFPKANAYVADKYYSFLYSDNGLDRPVGQEFSEYKENIMMKPVTRTAFQYKGQLIDVTLMHYESRNCGGAQIHEKNQALTYLYSFAERLHRGLSIGKPTEVDRALQKYYNR